jgi:hypothetical protein
MPLDLEKDNLRRVQGHVDPESELLNSPFVGAPRSPSTPGVNETFELALASGKRVFHKSFQGVEVTNALGYGQGRETPPLHECAAWRLAAELGDPLRQIICPCVLRDFDGTDGSLALEAPGWPNDETPLRDPQWCDPAAFFDSLIAQQDRHGGNWRWDGQALTLYDHGYTFAVPGQILVNGRFVPQRHSDGRAALAGWEKDALQQLVSSPSLLGMVFILEPHRAEALRDRAGRMLHRNEILAFKEF